jgi:hypothetical protein
MPLSIKTQICKVLVDFGAKFCLLFAPRRHPWALINQGISKAIGAIPGVGKISNTNNINSQDNQLPPSNQGITNV